MTHATLRLLVLEDEPLDAELEIAEIQQAGYTCQWERVETREDFLSRLEVSDYDLILSDYTLPDFDGLTALGLVLERQIDIPFILISGQLGEETAIDSLKAGATDYVLKSRLSRLVPVVRRALREHAELRQRRRIEEEIQQRNQDLEMLLFVISHDLREPLRSVLNFAEMLDERCSDRLDERGQDYLRRVMLGAERMYQQLADILTLARVQRAVQAEHGVSSSEIVHKALRSLELPIQQSQARIRVTNEFSLLAVDKEWGVAALVNLIANALKFTEPGHLPDIEISPYTELSPATGGPVGLMVRDRGPGVPPKSAEKIFELFQRAVGREIEGTGAGLAIVREIAKRYGGHAWVEPRPGGGSDFIITFGAHAMESKNNADPTASSRTGR